jgi:hypothetical protein
MHDIRLAVYPDAIASAQRRPFAKPSIFFEVNDVLEDLFFACSVILLAQVFCLHDLSPSMLVGVSRRLISSIASVLSLSSRRFASLTWNADRDRISQPNQGETLRCLLGKRTLS